VGLVVVASVVVALSFVALVVVALVVEDTGGGVTLVDILLALTADDVSGVLVSEIVVPGFVVGVVVVILTSVVAGVLLVVAEEEEVSDGSVELIWSISSSKASIVITGKGGGFAAVSSSLMDTG